MSPDELRCELDGVCSVCGDRAHTGPTWDQFDATLFEMLDELQYGVVNFNNLSDCADFSKLMYDAWERAKTQRV